MAETSSLRREIASAYLASGAKILSWVVVAGIVYRVGGSLQFAILALVRGTVGILNYVSLGVAPAMVRLLARTRAYQAEPSATAPPSIVLSYFSPEANLEARNLYHSGLTFSVALASVGWLLVAGYSFLFGRIHIPQMRADWEGAGFIVFFIGLGLLFRLLSDVGGAVLQTHGGIARDNWLLVEAEALWAVLTAAIIFVLWKSNLSNAPAAVIAAVAFTASGLLLMARRLVAARGYMGAPTRRWDKRLIGSIVAIGGLVTIAQLADFLYAPTDYILINHFLGTSQVAVYAPAVQIDAGLLVLVSGLAAVLFPRSAIAHAAGDAGVVRKYYLRGTAASALILIVAGLLMWLVSPMFFKAWFGNSMPQTRAILPLVLIHTVIGGSAMVGRSVLLAAGKFGAFAGSVLIAGVVNVMVSYVLVKAGWGLKGIIMGTIVAVVLRCLVWMPWFVMRSLREVKEIPVGPITVPEV